jgi:hypothetical protein
VPNLRVSQAVWDCLQRHAQTPDETPNAILARLLGVREPEPSDIPHGSRAFHEPIRQVLREFGGRASKREVLARIPEIVALTAADLKRNGRGQPRWERQVTDAARAMRVEGLLAPSRHGIWTLATRD